MTNPTGTLTFTNSVLGNLGSCTIQPSGGFTLNLSVPPSTPQGVYSVDVNYSGDGVYPPTNGTPFGQLTVLRVCTNDNRWHYCSQHNSGWWHCRSQRNHNRKRVTKEATR